MKTRSHCTGIVMIPLSAIGCFSEPLIPVMVYYKVKIGIKKAQEFIILQNRIFVRYKNVLKQVYGWS